MVIDAGLISVGPPPAAIRSLGDELSARHIAQKVGAPLAPGTPDPVTSAAEVIASAKEHGLPIPFKAAHGGGGRGLRVAHTLDEVPDQFDSAVREKLVAFGRGECFLENLSQETKACRDSIPRPLIRQYRLGLNT